MEKLGILDGHRHGRNTNINNFAPLFESENEEGIDTSPENKKNTVIVLI